MDPFVMDLVPDKCIGWGSYGAVWSLRNLDDECIKIASPANPTENHDMLIREVFGSTLLRRSSILLGNASWAVTMQRFKCNLSKCMTWNGSSLDAAIVRNVWCSVPDALYNLSRHNLAHRDISPSNVCMNAKNKTTVLIDYGLVGSNQEHDNQIQSVNQRPPEIFENQNVHPTSDVFALGMNMLTTWQNKLVVHVDSDTDDDYAQQKLQKYFQNDFHFWLLTHGQDRTTKKMTLKSTSAKLASLLDRMLVWDPHSRMTMLEVMRDSFWQDEDTPEEQSRVENFWNHLKQHRERDCPKSAYSQRDIFMEDTHKIVFVQRDFYHYSRSGLLPSDRQFLIQVLYSICEHFSVSLDVFLCAVMIHEMMQSYSGPSQTLFMQDPTDLTLEQDFQAALWISMTIQGSTRGRASLSYDIWRHCFSMGLFTKPRANLDFITTSLSRVIQCLRGCLPLGAISVLRQRYAYEKFAWPGLDGLRWIQNHFDCDTVLKN